MAEEDITDLAITAAAEFESSTVYSNTESVPPPPPPTTTTAVECTSSTEDAEAMIMDAAADFKSKNNDEASVAMDEVAEVEKISNATTESTEDENAKMCVEFADEKAADPPSCKEDDNSYTAVNGSGPKKEDATGEVPADEKEKTKDKEGERWRGNGTLISRYFLK